MLDCAPSVAWCRTCTRVFKTSTALCISSNTRCHLQGASIYLLQFQSVVSERFEVMGSQCETQKRAKTLSGETKMALKCSPVFRIDGRILGDAWRRYLQRVTDVGAVRYLRGQIDLRREFQLQLFHIFQRICQAGTNQRLLIFAIPPTAAPAAASKKGINSFSTLLQSLSRG